MAMQHFVLVNSTVECESVWWHCLGSAKRTGIIHGICVQSLYSNVLQISVFFVMTTWLA